MTSINLQPSVEPESKVSTALEGTTSLLDSIIENSKAAANDTEKARTRDLIGELAEQVLSGTVVVKRDLASSLDARVAELDRLISEFDRSSNRNSSNYC